MRALLIFVLAGLLFSANAQENDTLLFTDFSCGNHQDEWILVGDKVFFADGSNLKHIDDSFCPLSYTKASKLKKINGATGLDSMLKEGAKPPTNYAYIHLDEPLEAGQKFAIYVDLAIDSEENGVFKRLNFSFGNRPDLPANHVSVPKNVYYEPETSSILIRDYKLNADWKTFNAEFEATGGESLLRVGFPMMDEGLILCVKEILVLRVD